MIDKSFKQFYFKKKDVHTFNTIFEKWYRKGYWGKIDKDKIKQQQFDWYKKVKQMIHEKDFGSLLMSVEHRDKKVSRDMFSKLTKINIRKKSGKVIKKKLQEFCLNEASDFKKLQDNKQPLTPEERKKCIDCKARWNNGDLAVFKSVDEKGKVTYITHTHRAYNTAPTLKGAISRFHNFIKGTA